MLYIRMRQNAEKSTDYETVRIVLRNITTDPCILRNRRYAITNNYFTTEYVISWPDMSGHHRKKVGIAGHLRTNTTVCS